MLRLLLLRLLALLLRPLAQRRASAPPRAILFLKPDHLGDVLLATPALLALRERFPEARIVAMVGPWSRAALQGCAAINELRTLPFPGFTRAGQGSPLAPYLLLAHTASKLRRERFDAALLGRDDHWWGALLVLAAGIPLRAGFAHPLCRPMLTLALPLERRQHVAAQGLVLVEALRPSPPRPPSPALQEKKGPGEQEAIFNPSETAQAWASAWLAEQGIDPARLLLIHPGSGGPSKHWLSIRWSRLADELVAAGWHVVLTGGPGEEALVGEVAAGMTQDAWQLAGKTSLDQLGALCARARLVLGVDSGPLHLAGAVGAPTLRLYGPSDTARFGPWGDPACHRALSANIWCSPCGVFSHCPRGRAPAPCMAAISVDEVLEAVQRDAVRGGSRPTTTPED
jgi:ADP-heptose:LPS heptosyltransferase